MIVELSYLIATTEEHMRLHSRLSSLTASGTQETVNPAFFVYREWLLYVKIWDWYRVCSFLRLNAFYLFFIGLANSSVASKAQT
jgi:hypothetical protein